MLVKDFLFSQRFTSVTDLQLNEACEVVTAQFSGVLGLWSSLPPIRAQEKRNLCLNYLVAWYLADTYPDQCPGVQGTGGMPIVQKRAGPVMIRYNNVVRQGSGALDALTSNSFGVKALTLIQSAPENYRVYA